MYGKPCASRHPGPDDRPSRVRSLCAGAPADAPRRPVLQRSQRPEQGFLPGTDLNLTHQQAQAGPLHADHRRDQLSQPALEPQDAQLHDLHIALGEHASSPGRHEHSLAVAFAVLGVSDDMPSPPRREPEAVAMGTPVALPADEWNPSAVRLRSACDRDPPSHAKHGTPPRASATPHPEITGPKIGLESRAGTRKGCMTGFR